MKTKGKQSSKATHAVVLYPPNWKYIARGQHSPTKFNNLGKRQRSACYCQTIGLTNRAIILREENHHLHILGWYLMPWSEKTLIPIKKRTFMELLGATLDQATSTTACIIHQDKQILLFVPLGANDSGKDKPWLCSISTPANGANDSGKDKPWLCSMSTPAPVACCVIVTRLSDHKFQRIWKINFKETCHQDFQNWYQYRPIVHGIRMDNIGCII